MANNPDAADGRAVQFKKMKNVLAVLKKLLMYILAVPAVVLIRLIKPWLLVRLGALHSSRIGHFAINTELYLCAQDAGINKPMQRHVDLFFHSGPVSNRQLATMWGRVLRIYPASVLGPIFRINQWLPGAAIHDVVNTHSMDIHNLIDRFPPHLQFTAEENTRGEAGLLAMGIPAEAPFVCLIVRDSAYLTSFLPQGDWDYHNFRDSNIQSYVLAAETLAERGYYVIRMGAKVHEAIKTTHPMVIDYATNGMRSDFMDIFLGAKCAFCISTGTGWDEIPGLTRRPIVYVNYSVLGYVQTSSTNHLSIAKKYISQESQKMLTFHEIFSHGVGFCTDGRELQSKGIQLIDNTPEEIRDVVVEMAERLNGTWQPREGDEALQKRFWELFSTDALSHQGTPYHGEIHGRFGTHFLRNNRDWLQ